MVTLVSDQSDMRDMTRNRIAMLIKIRYPFTSGKPLQLSDISSNIADRIATDQGKDVVEFSRAP